MQGGSIYWGDSFPYKSQFSTSPDGPWHDKQQEGDKYRRDTYDGGKLGKSLTNLSEQTDETV